MQWTPPPDGIAMWVRPSLWHTFITVADHELMLPTILTKRLINHATMPGPRT